MEKENENYQGEIDITTLFYDILHDWWVILLGALAAAILAFVIVNEAWEPQYTTRTTFVVGSRNNFNASNNLTMTNNMAQTFQKILQSNVMRKILKKKLGAEELTEVIKAEVIGETNLLVLTVTADTPEKSIDVMRAVMENYTRISYYTAGDAMVEVLEEPGIPMVPDNPRNTAKAVVLAFTGALAALSALFGLISYFRDTIKKEEDIEKKLDAKNLGVIPYERKNKLLRDSLKNEKRGLLITDPLSGFSFVESYKKLATRVDYQMGKNGAKVLVVTSVAENEGKSTAAANLAIGLAQQSKKVVLFDGDFRRPSQFLIFEKTPKEDQEIGEVIKGKKGVSLALRECGVPGMYLVLGRNCYSSSTEMVQSRRMRQILEVLRENTDYVIIDTPPCGLMGDAQAIAQYADAVLLTVKQNYSYVGDINDALDSFREQKVKVLGVVLNNVRTISPSEKKNYYGHYGKYGYYSRAGRNQENQG